MIFLNRRRTIVENGGSEIIKDPSKYWYVEKYVYGVLKETVEIPLKTSTKFTAIKSGYFDDEFYGWSVTSTSTVRTFSDTSTYSNTTTTIKNKLDSNNTLKIYAVYKYPASAQKTCSITYTGNYKFTITEDSTLKITHNTVTHRTLTLSSGNTVSDVTKHESIYVSVYDANENKKYDFNTGSKDVLKHDILKFYVNSRYDTPSGSASGPPSGTYEQYTSRIDLECTSDMLNWNVTKYRVESHT